MVSGRACLPPLGSSGGASHSAMSSQNNRQADEVLHGLLRLSEPHARFAMRLWENVRRQRPTLHPAAGTAPVLPQRLGKRDVCSNGHVYTPCTSQCADVMPP